MKIHIFGASGSGVTTTGKLLEKALGLKYFDSDNYFWIKTASPFTERRNPAHRNQLLTADLHAAENWILGGSIIHWGEELFSEFDLIIFLYLPQDVRLDRLKKREFERYGERIYTNEESAKQFNAFIAWAADYDNDTGLANRTLNAHQAWLKQINHPVLKIIGNYTAEERLKIILDKLASEKIAKTS